MNSESQITTQRIQKALTRAGLTHVSEDPRENLASLGLDSLMIALSTLELEREFQVKLKLPEKLSDVFENLQTVLSWIQEQVH